MTEQEKREKMEKYLSIANSYGENLRYLLIRPWREKGIIIKYTEEVDRAFEELSNPESSEYMENSSQEDILLEATKRMKMELFYRALHPNYENYEQLEPKEKAKHDRDKEFIREHFREIETRYVGIYEDTYSRLDNNDMIKTAIMHVRAFEYAKTLGVDFKSPQWTYILTHIDDIHAAYEKFNDPDNRKYLGNVSAKAKIKASIKEAGRQEMIRIKQAQESSKRDLEASKNNSNKPEHHAMPDSEWREEDWPEEEQDEKDEEPAEKDWRDDDYMR